MIDKKNQDRIKMARRFAVVWTVVAIVLVFVVLFVEFVLNFSSSLLFYIAEIFVFGSLLYTLYYYRLKKNLGKK